MSIFTNKKDKPLVDKIVSQMMDSGNARILKLIADIEDIDAKSQKGITLLSAACITGNLSVANYIINLGADVNVKFNGMSNLVLAIIAEQNSKELTELLLKNNVDPNEKYEGFSPLFIALFAEKDEVVKVLADYGGDTNYIYNNISPLWHCYIANKFELAKYLIFKGSDTNYQYNGQSLIWESIISKKIEFAKFLILKGADVNVNYNGSTILHEAVKLQDQEMIKLALNAGADTNATDLSGKTPIELAADIAFENENNELSINILQLIIDYTDTVSGVSIKISGETSDLAETADLY
ncbi:MAG: ankyrin repeat domain-containing protein [Rickettsiaceae bacterium]|nr:ankyrin repeat domain-containing protein [Rickettsiaceae bacterium]